MRCHLRYDEAVNVIETHEHKGDFKEPSEKAWRTTGTILPRNAEELSSLAATDFVVR